jgi:hypothetical protein
MKKLIDHSLFKRIIPTVQNMAKDVDVKPESVEEARVISELLQSIKRQKLAIELFVKSNNEDSYSNLKEGTNLDVTILFSNTILTNYSSIMDRLYHVINVHLNFNVESDYNFTNKIIVKLKGERCYSKLEQMTFKIFKDHIKPSKEKRNDIIHKTSYDDFSHKQEFFIKDLIDILDYEGRDTVEINIEERELISQKVDKSLINLGRIYQQKSDALEGAFYKIFTELESLKSK